LLLIVCDFSVYGGEKGREMMIKYFLNWKAFVVIVGAICCITVLYMKIPVNGAHAVRVENRALSAPGPAGCASFAESFTINGSHGGRTIDLIKTANCGSSIRVQFTQLPYSIAVMVCTVTDSVQKCETMHGRFVPETFTDKTSHEVARVNGGTKFFVMYTALDSNAPQGSGHIVVSY
jgi:hypothetical protein